VCVQLAIHVRLISCRPLRVQSPAAFDASEMLTDSSTQSRRLPDVRVPGERLTRVSVGAVVTVRDNIRSAGD